MKAKIKTLIIDSIGGLFYISVAAPFLLLSCLIIGMIVSAAIKVFMFGFNLF